jgi:hypothetical protein
MGPDRRAFQVCMLRVMRAPRRVLLALLLTPACAPPPEPTVPVVHAMAPPQESPKGSGQTIEAHVSGDAPVSEVARAMAAAARGASVPCYKALFVWGSLRGVEQARPMHVSAGGASLAGYVVCEENLPEFLAAQKANPRLVGARGGSCDLRWADAQLYMRRSWGNGEAPLGDLSADTSDVLQKGELLAAVFDTKSDPTGTAEVVVRALSRVPKFFLFGMWALPAG